MTERDAPSVARPSSTRWHFMFAYGLAALCAVWAIWANVDHAIDGIRTSLALEQTEIFADMRIQALQGDSNAAAQSLEYVVGYYPSGTKQVTGSHLDRIVERGRSEAIAAIIGHLRTITEEDLGDDPDPWIAKYGRGQSAGQ